MTSFKIFHLEDGDWDSIRPEFTSKITGKTIIPKDWVDIKLTLTKVESHGEFPVHKDDYHHIFYFINGSGIIFIENEEFDIVPNLLVEIPAGLSHGYKNTSTKEMLLITGNIPIRKT